MTFTTEPLQLSTVHLAMLYFLRDYNKPAYISDSFIAEAESLKEAGFVQSRPRSSYIGTAPPALEWIITDAGRDEIVRIEQTHRDRPRSK